VNIAVLVAGLPPERIGGAERQACELARRLALHHAVTVFTRTATIPSELAGVPTCVVTQRTRIGLRRVRFAADLVETLLHFRRSATRFDVIVAFQSVIDGLIGVFAKFVFGTPLVVLIRGASEYRGQSVQSRWLTPLVFQHADRVGVQSIALRDDVVSVLEASRRRAVASTIRTKLFVSPNGIDLPPPLRSGQPHGLLCVARLTPEKGVGVLIDAMRRCPSEHLTIVGDGPERAVLEQAARDLSNVTFVGAVAHARVMEYMMRAKVLVLPSQYEGQPNVVMEAMALGIPVIATRVGGLPDLISAGTTGLLIPFGDASAIAGAIHQISDDDALRARLAENGRLAIRPYDWAIVLERFERMLDEVVATRRASEAATIAL